MLCDSHTIWTTAVQTSSVSRPPRPSTTTARGARVVRHSGSSTSPIQAPGRLPIPRCNPALDKPVLHNPFSLLPPGAPATFYSSQFYFLLPRRPFGQGAAPQHLSLRLIPRMRWQHPFPPNRGAGPSDAVFSPPIVFWTLLAVSGRGTRQASEVIVLLTQRLALPSSLYFAEPPNRNRAGVKFSQ